VQRSRQLDGLRAIAFLSVFIHHGWRLPLLWIGVDAFFVLSGFLITGNLLAMKASEGSFFKPFYLRRAFRILPPYCIAIALSAAFFRGFFTAMLAYLVVLKRGPLFRVLTQPGMVFLGRISYMMYLVHQIAIELIPSSALVALLGTILFSAVSWKLIEEPLLAWSKRIQQRVTLPEISPNLPSPYKSSVPNAEA
jgi:peptidoglycan/LPS O-acetylase OafA/YrhL